jgi:hypothetical protein
VDVVLVDYADRMVSGKSKVDGGHDYKIFMHVFQELSMWATRERLWLWTASQRKGLDKGKKVADAEDASDSKHKGRIADVVITLNIRGELNDEMLYGIAKDRMASSGGTVGPLPTDFARARMVYLNDR